MSVSLEQPMRPYLKALGESLDETDASLAQLAQDLQTLDGELDDTNTEVGTIAQNVQGLQRQMYDIPFEYVRTYDTVADMQADDNLLSGMTCHTNGFHASGDGGAAYYAVGTSGDIALHDNLYATEIPETSADVTKSLLTFGDSWGNSVNEWPTYLAQYMGLEEHRYNVSGASFPFTAQLDAAIADFPSDSQSTIACAVVYGGVNNAAAQVVTDFTPWATFINTFRQYFPNVRLYVFPMNVPTNKYTEATITNAYFNVFRSMENAYAYFAKNYFENTIVVPHCNFMLDNESPANTFYTDNYLHPNQNGCMIIAKNMFNAMHGIYQSYELLPRLTLPAGVSIIRNAYIDEEGLHTPSIAVDTALLDNNGEYLMVNFNYTFGADIYVPYDVYNSAGVYIESKDNFRISTSITVANQYIDLSFRTDTGANRAILTELKSSSRKIHIRPIVVPFLPAQQLFS